MPESEIWKDVVGYEGLYKVSNKGNVRSVEWIGVRGRKCGGRTLKGRGVDYIQVGLYKDGIMKKKLIHRLVLEAFVENPNNLPEVNHLDEVKINNELSNLEWCTRKHNMNHGTQKERAAQTRSKKVKAVNVETGEVITFNSATEAGNKGYNRVSINRACNGTYKTKKGSLMGGDGRTYRGHRWSYE